MATEQPGNPPKQRVRPRKETIDEALLKHAPWMPADYEIADANAIKALAAGTANPEQQVRALRWIMTLACALPDWAYRPGANDRDTNIALGRQFVGHQIQKMIAAPTSRMRRDEPRADAHDPTVT